MTKHDRMYGLTCAAITIAFAELSKVFIGNGGQLLFAILALVFALVTVHLVLRFVDKS